LNPDPAFQVNPDPDTDPGFYGQKLKEKKTAEIFFFSFFDHKLQFTYPYVSSKDVQVTVEGKPSALKKRTSSTSKDEIY
jgi:hypothetical protein